MTRASYISHARKVKILGTLMFIVVGGSLAVASSLLFERVRHWVDVMQNDLRSHGHPDWASLVSVVPPLLLFAVPILVPFVLLFLLDRHIGLPCPRCGRSLTLLCNDRVVASTGRCELCHQSIFDQVEEPAEPSSGGNGAPPHASV